MTVYVEAYAFINAAMDLFLLAVCALFSGRRLRPAGAAASCALGGVYSVAAYSLFTGFLLNFAGKALCAAAMVLLAFGKTPPLAYIKLIAAFFIASFAAGGTGFGLLYLLGAGGFGALWLIPTVIACAGGVYLILNTRKERRLSVWRTHVMIEGENGCVVLSAFIDSGNNLTEPVTALPVAVCFFPGAAEYMKPSGLCVSYSSIGGEGELPLYTPKAVYSLRGEKKERLADIFIAFSSRGQTDGIDLLLPPSAIL